MTRQDACLFLNCMRRIGAGILWIMYTYIVAFCTDWCNPSGLFSAFVRMGVGTLVYMCCGTYTEVDGIRYVLGYIYRLWMGSVPYGRWSTGMH